MNRFALKLLVALLVPAAASTASAQIVLEQQNAVYDVDSTYMRPGTYTLPAFANGSQLQLTFDYDASREIVIVDRALISATGLTVTLPPPQPGDGGSMCPAGTIEVCTQAREDDAIIDVCECQTPTFRTTKVTSGLKVPPAKDDAA